MSGSDTKLDEANSDILDFIDIWISEGSGWTIERIEKHFINFVKYQPLKGSSYIELPKESQHPRKGLINIQNKDNECFRWCHIRYLNPQKKNPQRIKDTDKEFINKLDYNNVKFPVMTKDIPKVEKQNNIHVNVNVFGWKNSSAFSIYISVMQHKEVMNLLFYKNHCVLINNFNRFMYNYTKHKDKKHFCMYCLQCFSSADILEKHKKNCITVNGKQAINMPKGGEKVQFKNYHKKLEVPFVIYADFEATVEKIVELKIIQAAHTLTHIKNIKIAVMLVK